MLLKFCGLKLRREFELAQSLKVDFCGINLVPESVRYLPIDRAAIETRALSSRLVLVFRDAPIKEIVSAVGKLQNVAGIQLHGSESVEFVEELRQQVSAMQIWKAVGVAVGDDVNNADSFIQSTDLILFDARSLGGGKNFGGEGKTFDWNVVPQGHGRFKAWGLSGGINASNIVDAMRRSPGLIDIASGIEEVRGTKSEALMTQVAGIFHKSKAR